LRGLFVPRPVPVIVKGTDVLNVRERALNAVPLPVKLKKELGRVLPANTRSVVVRLDTNGVEEKLSDANVVASVNQLLDVPDPVHVYVV
jgi:hypothetical protein